MGRKRGIWKNRSAGRNLYPILYLFALLIVISTYTKANGMADNIETKMERVCIVGSGNWGSAIAKIVGFNCARLGSCETRVNMWVFEEIIEDSNGFERNLSEVINDLHENPKYLPGIQLPPNVVAVPDLRTACQGSTLLIFVLPHQFLEGVLPIVKKYANPSCRCISLIKGLEFCPQTHSPKRISQTISDATGFPCGVLMGANVANEVALEYFCESTLACNFRDDETNMATCEIFDSPPYFLVQHITDVAGAEVCGALKNIFALGAGFVDGIGLGGNTKAALLRVGLLEIHRFCQLFWKENDHRNTVFAQSCGVADLITTCYGGRNRHCAEIFARKRIEASSDYHKEEDLEKLWNEIEVKELNGQHLQGASTLKEVYRLLERRKILNSFPLISHIYQIAFTGKSVNTISYGIRDCKL